MSIGSGCVVMANYYTTAHNQFIANAPEIHSYLTGTYMREYAGAILDCGTGRRLYEPMKYVKVSSFRVAEGPDEHQHRALAAAKMGLSSFFVSKCAVGYFLVSNGRECGLFLASEGGVNYGFDDCLKAAIPDFAYENRFIDKGTKQQCALNGGVLLGLPPLSEKYVDQVLDVLGQMKGMVGILAWPTEIEQIYQYRNGLVELQERAETLGSIDNTFGSGSRRTIKEVVPAVNSLNSYLKKEVDRWAGAENMWEVCAWFSADTALNAERLGAALAGAVGTVSSAREAASGYIMTLENAFQSDSLYIPLAQYRTPPYEVPAGVEKSPLLSYLTTSELATYMQLPQYGHIGINVINSSGESNPLRPFAVNAQQNGDILLGAMKEGAQPFWLNLDDLNEHMLVTGATGSGKTNTVMTILDEAHRNHVPFCVIEAAKKDYWYLRHTMEDLEVYSAGQDAKALFIDPFIPEEGTVVGNHIDSLLYAFSGAFDMEAPTRLALSGLIKYAYVRQGWELGEIYYRQEKQCPTVQMLIDYLPQFMDEELQYGQEVSDNIRGSILNRLRSLNEGTIGAVINSGGERSLTGEALCSGSVVIELDDFSLDVKPFIAELILVKVGQYLRRQDAAKSLKNIIVLEEAHNVFGRIADGTGETSKSIASSYFSALLSEIREYGTGLIIADQGASKLNDNAISNTKVKIMHSLGSSDDVKAEEYALHLTEAQKRLIPELPKGTALVAVRGRPDTWRVAVREAQRSIGKNIACIFCSHRRFCSYDTIKDGLRGEDYHIAMTATNVLMNRYSGAALNVLVEDVQRQYQLDSCDKSCLLGYILGADVVKCSDREKRRIMYLFNKE